MGLLGQLLGGVVVHVGQGDLEFHPKAERAVVDLAERNPRSHSRILDIGFLLAADQPQWARVINTASEAFLFGSPGQPNYSAAKAGIAALTLSVAHGCGRYGVRANAITPVTLLKIGHHGSRTSTTPAFLATAAPREAVLSVGRRNPFGHPRPEVIARIAQPRTRLYRTDQFGLTRLRGVFVRLEQPVAFDAVDDRPVDLIFALFAPPEASGEHLRALARVSRVLRQSDLREQLRKAHGADAIHALLVQEARPSAA